MSEEICVTIEGNKAYYGNMPVETAIQACAAAVDKVVAEKDQLRTDLAAANDKVRAMEAMLAAATQIRLDHFGNDILFHWDGGWDVSSKDRIISKSHPTALDAYAALNPADTGEAVCECGEPWRKHRKDWIDGSTANVGGIEGKCTGYRPKQEDVKR